MDTEFMAAAIQCAREGIENGEIPIGAVVVLSGEILAKGYCQDRTKGLLAHAELVALSAIDRRKFSVADRKNMTIYSTLEPCIMCLGAVMSSFVGRLVYSLKAPADGAVRLIQNQVLENGSYENYRIPEIIGGVGYQDALALFREFIDIKKTGPYADFARGVIAGNHLF